MEQKIDLFTPIHKAIRAIIYETGKMLQSTDFRDQNESISVLNQLDNMLNLLEEHARHEDELIFPPIEAMAPGISLELEKQHEEGDAKVEQLRQLIGEMRSSDAGKRAGSSNLLNLFFTDFIAFYLAHMNREEETVLPASQEKLTNEQLAAIRVEVQLDTNPERYSEWLRWMLPALNIQELVPLFKQVRLSAPPSIYHKIRSIGEQVIDRRRWDIITLNS